MASRNPATLPTPLASRGVRPDDLAWSGAKAYTYADAARPRVGFFRRFVSCLFLSFCALFVADSASWATTPPPDGSPSAAPSSEPSSTSPETDPTSDPSTPPEQDAAPEAPAPAESTTTETAGTEAEPTVVQLETDQMAVLLLGACVSALCLPALVVIGYGNRG